jgi:hypothetical protein
MFMGALKFVWIPANLAEACCGLLGYFQIYDRKQRIQSISNPAGEFRAHHLVDAFEGRLIFCFI